MYRNIVPMIISLYVLVVCPVSATVPSGVNLAKLDNWDIVVAENATPSEIYAAEEFQSHFALASNVHLPIVSQTGPATGGQHHIFIGLSPAMRVSNVGFSTDEFGESWSNLIELYEAWDKPEKATKWRAKLPQTEVVDQ